MRKYPGFHGWACSTVGYWSIRSNYGQTVLGPIALLIGLSTDMPESVKVAKTV